MTRPKGRASKRQRSDAIRVLHEVAIDESAADHARVAAARAIIRDGRNDSDDESAEPTREPAILCLPVNHRDVVALGIMREEGFIRVNYDGGTPEGLVNRDRWLAELHAEFASASAPLLPAPEKRPPMTSTDRVRRWRERRREAKRGAQTAKPLPDLANGRATNPPMPDCL
jgi:hypothetical protein